MWVLSFHPSGTSQHPPPPNIYTHRCPGLTSVHVGNTITLPWLVSPPSFPVGVRGQLLQSPGTAAGAQRPLAGFFPQTTGGGGTLELSYEGMGGWLGLPSGAPGQAKGAQMVAGEGQEQYLERKESIPSRRATASSSPKMMATVSPPVRPLGTVAHGVRKSGLRGLRAHRDDGG